MPANELDAELDLIREAAREAGRIAMRYFGRTPDVWMKTGQSPVSEAVLRTQATRITSALLHHEIARSQEALSDHLLLPVHLSPALGNPHLCLK